VVTPNPDAIFSQLVFSRAIDANYQPVGSATVFVNPIKNIIATFSYDKMTDGTQWTALWYREGELVHFESLVWDGGTGGYGFTEWEPDPGEWLAGEYEVQVFVGMDWKVVGRFTVQGDPPTKRPTQAPSVTATVSATPSPSRTQTPSRTPVPSNTRKPTNTPRPSDTPWPSATPSNTPSPRPSRTPAP
jgi:hypothetical protein